MAVTKAVLVNDGGAPARIINFLAAEAITAGSAILDFVMTDMAGNISNSTAGTAKTTIVCHTECTKGDYVNIFSDGSTYYGEAVSAIDDAIDHTAQ